MNMTTGTVKNGFDGWLYRLVELDFMGSARILEAAMSAVKAVPAILILLWCVRPAAAAGLLLTPDNTAPHGWRVLPPLESMVWQPELLLKSGSRTIDAAAERVGTALAQAADAPDWLRLERFDLTAVGDCQTCQPPPLDPHRYTPQAAPIALDPRQYLFFAEVAERLRGTRFQPVVVVPPNGPPPDWPMPDNLLFVLAGPAGPARFAIGTLAGRQQQSEAWDAQRLRFVNLVSDGLGEFYGLPLNGELLRQQATSLPHPAVSARDEETFLATGPAWLTARLRAVAVGGETTQAGDRWRVDEPELARAVDVFAPAEQLLGDQGAERAAKLTLAALRALADWDEARAEGREPPSATLLELLQQRREAHGKDEPAGIFSGAFMDFVKAARPLPTAALPPVPPAVSFDSVVDEDEWRGAAMVTLSGDRSGQPTERPATVWLAADDEGLAVAVIATEPDPAEATLGDRIVLRCDAGDAGLVRIDLPVGQPIERRAGPDAEPERVKGVQREAGFDGPGWTMEARLTWSQLGFQAVDLRAMAITTEHRAGSLQTITAWCPDGGAEWNPHRWPRITLR